MGCNKCGGKGCNSCGGGSNQQSNDIANALAQLTAQQDQLNNLTNSLQAFLSGHPILLIDQVDDVNQFDLSTGKGFGTWQGWGICNGTVYLNTVLNKNIATPNMTDRVPVQAGGQYALDATQGNDDINLSVAQLPAHNHGITDPGHTHVVNDPGHNHATTQAPHTHGGSSAPHVHTFTSNPITHNHTYASPDTSIGYTPGGSSTNTADLTLSGTGVSSPVATGTTDATSVTVTIAAASISISVNNAFTGITNDTATTGISTQNTGTGANIDIRNKSYAVFFAMKIQ